MCLKSLLICNFAIKHKLDKYPQYTADPHSTPPLREQAEGKRIFDTIKKGHNADAPGLRWPGKSGNRNT